MRPQTSFAGAANRVSHALDLTGPSVALDTIPGLHSDYDSNGQRLLLDVLDGDSTLFMRRDEQEAAWMWVEPIMQAWAASGNSPKLYTAGTWGPAAATALISRDGFSWHEDY